MADKHGQPLQVCYDKLKARYDGYRFSPYSQEQVYNPFSLLNALVDGAYEDYWYATGLPSFLFQMMVKQQVRVEELSSLEIGRRGLFGRSAESISAVALLYQTGYLTIDRYDQDMETYTMRFPNEEVKSAFLQELLDYYCNSDENNGLSVNGFFKAMVTGKADEFLIALHDFLAQRNNLIAGKKELYFHNVMVVIFSLLGLKTHAEVSTSHGRIDAVVETPQYIYLFEFKLDQPVEAAMKQIEDKQYAAIYNADKRKLFKLGVRFDPEKRNIAACIIRTGGQDDITLRVEGDELKLDSRGQSTECS